MSEVAIAGVKRHKPKMGGASLHVISDSLGSDHHRALMQSKTVPHFDVLMIKPF